LVEIALGKKKNSPVQLLGLMEGETYEERKRLAEDRQIKRRQWDLLS